MKLTDVVRGVEEKEPYYGAGEAIPVPCDRVASVWNGGHNSLASAEVVVLEDKIQDVLVQTFGCKPSKEDCSFKGCTNWGKCECLRSNFTAAVSSGSIIRLKEKE